MSEQVEWVLIGIDEKTARRQGIPPSIPVPKAQFESLADTGLKPEIVRAWIKDFLNNSEPGKSGVWRKQNSATVTKLEAFVDKAGAWEKAQAAFGESDYDKAIAALKRVVMMDPDDHAARLNLGSALANQKNFAEAMKHFKAVRPTFEGDPDYHVTVSHVELAMGRRDDAIGQLVLALEAKPDHQPALDGLAALGVLVAIYENPHDATSLTYVRADSVVEYLVVEWDKEPRDAKFFLEQLTYHEREGRFEIALLAAERAAKVGGGERASLATIAALRELGRLDDSLAKAQAFVAEFPDSAGGHVELSRCLSRAGRDDDASREVDRALELDPGDQLALVLRFWPADRSDIQQVNEAIPALKAFAETHANSPGVLRSLARAYVVVGRVDDALALFAQACELAPADDDLRAEYWNELGKQAKFDVILADAAKVPDMGKRDWKLRWNEAEAYAGAGRRIEARAAFSAINFDEKLHVDIRKRAKRAVKSIDEGGVEGALV